MSRAGDPFADHAGAYVLGALSPEDRHAYERHLRGCGDCAEDVRGIAGLPGLLSRVPAADALAEPGPPPPDTLLPSLLAGVRRARRRRRAITTATIGLAAAACVAVAAVVGVMAGGDSTRQPVARPPATMTAVAPSPIGATAMIVDAAWGSRIDLACIYRTGEETSYPAPRYRLVAIDSTGRARQVASWNAVPDRESHLTASTSLHSEDIKALEIRTDAGRTLLRLPWPVTGRTPPH